MLARASSDAVQALTFAGGDSEEQPNGNSNSPDQGDTNASTPVAAQCEASGTAQVAAAACRTIGLINISEEERGPAASSARSTSSLILPQRAATSQAQAQAQTQTQPQPKTAQADANRDSSSIQSAANQDPSLQITVAQPSINIVEVSGTDPKSGEAPASRALSEAAASSLESQMLRAVAQPIEAPGAQTTPAVPSPEVNNAPDATAGSQFLVAEFTLPANLPATNTLAQGASLSKDDLTVSANVASPSKTAGSVAAANPAGTVTAATASTVKNSPTPDSSSFQHVFQNGGQASQQAQTAAAQSTFVVAKSLDAAATQTIAFPSHGPSGTQSAAHATTGDNSEAPLRTQDQGDLVSEQPYGASVGGNAGINTAQLIQSVNGSEMRLGMHSTEFGDISIRTSVSTQQLQAQINVDHGELNSAITANIPSLQAKLGSDFGLHTSIEVNQLGGSHNGQGQPSQQNQYPSARRVPGGEVAQTADTDSQTIPAPLLAGDDGRLDIRI